MLYCFCVFQINEHQWDGTFLCRLRVSLTRHETGKFIWAALRKRFVPLDATWTGIQKRLLEKKESEAWNKILLFCHFISISKERLCQRKGFFFGKMSFRFTNVFTVNENSCQRCTVIEESWLSLMKFKSDTWVSVAIPRAIIWKNLVPIERLHIFFFFLCLTFQE